MIDVLVVGGGFAGFWAAVAARRELGPEGAVLLVSRDRHLIVRPRLYEADPGSMRVDLPPLLAKVGVGFREGEGVSVRSGELVMAGGTGIRFRRLVVATGSVMRRPEFAGATRVHSVDTMEEAIRFETALRRLGRGRVSPAVSVIGAGFTGIELALELRGRMADLAGQERADTMRVTLVDRSGTLAPGLDAVGREAVAAALREARVELRLGAGVASYVPGGLLLEGGGHLPSDLAVLATGLVAAPLAWTLSGGHDAWGRVEVDRCLRATGEPDVFVAGDAAAALADEGRPTLFCCQQALQLGRVAGGNAARDLTGAELLPYAQRDYVTCIDLGDAGAVLTSGWERKTVSTGATAKGVKRRINRELIYPPVGVSAEELLAASVARG